MCYLCYHKKGRTKLAFGCEHKSEVHYSKGLCQACYISQYAEVYNKLLLLVYSFILLGSQEEKNRKKVQEN